MSFTCGDIIRVNNKRSPHHGKIGFVMGEIEGGAYISLPGGRTLVLSSNELTLIREARTPSDDVEE